MLKEVVYIQGNLQTCLLLTWNWFQSFTKSAISNGLTKVFGQVFFIRCMEKLNSPNFGQFNISFNFYRSELSYFGGFPGDARGKELACQCRRHRDAGSIPGSGKSSGGGHSNPLQYSCLENPMDRRAWWATAHGVPKSQTRLSDQQTHTIPSAPYKLI